MRSEKGDLVISSKVRDWVSEDSVRQEIGNALGGWMDEKEFLAQIMIALQKKGTIKYKNNQEEYSPGPADCTPRSQYEAAHTCASLQLLPTLGQVAFIPYQNKGALECTVMPQWQGYKALIERHPLVRDIDADIVFVGEAYRFDTRTRQLEHEYDPFVDRDVLRDLSNIIGGYLRITFTDDREPKFHFVTKHTIETARSCAKTQMIWNPFPKEMVLKTIYRNAFARRVVPIDPLVIRRMNKLIENEDLIHQNDPTRAIVLNAPAKPLSEVTKQIYSQPRIVEPDEQEPKKTAIVEEAGVTEMTDEDIRHQLDLERQESE